ncbi:Fic family protein [Aerococcus mictus]|uniref:Fic family protein n=1 Tax=Aerococcus mictus TaxID=2976810 RepID=UPI000DCC67B6|nr:Fic family protein [Aerococcus mictus]RAV78080.1 cell filamentation protein Fic [Aerococcus mictus]
MIITNRLLEEKKTKFSGGLYDWTQYKFAYNSSKIEGTLLSEYQTRLMYETKKIKFSNETAIEIDDLIEVQNHFKCFDFILENYEEELSHEYIKKLHSLLKSGISSDQSYLMPVGNYKTFDNEVGYVQTSPAERTEDDMTSLLLGYNYKSHKSLEDIVDFHVQFETIHPFADGNGRVGRLIMFKECLANDIIPFVIRVEVGLDYRESLDDYRNGGKGRLLNIVESEQNIYLNKCIDLRIIDPDQQYDLER